VAGLEKLKQKLKNNPRGIRYAELIRVLRDLGFEETRSRGSHHVFRRRGGPSLLIVKPHGGRRLCAIADVKKVIEFLEQSQEEPDER